MRREPPAPADPLDAELQRLDRAYAQGRINPQTYYMTRAGLVALKVQQSRTTSTPASAQPVLPTPPQQAP